MISSRANAVFASAASKPHQDAFMNAFGDDLLRRSLILIIVLIIS